MDRWTPSFAYGAESDPTVLALTLPVGRFSFGLALDGTSRRTASGALAGTATGNRKALVLPLRFYETEWPDVLAWLAVVQDGQPFTWEPNDFPLVVRGGVVGEQIDTAVTVRLVAPRRGEAIQPSRNAYGPVLELAVVIVRDDGAAWDVSYDAPPPVPLVESVA